MVSVKSYETPPNVLSSTASDQPSAAAAKEMPPPTALERDSCNNTVITVTPQHFNQQNFYDTYEYFIPQKPTVKERLSKSCSCSAPRLLKYVRRRLPIVKWLPKYSFRNDLLSDVIAGVTLAIVQIPQAMAFTMLSNAPPVLGLYSTFFSTALYFFLGTSKYSSLGMAGTTSLVVGHAINDRLSRLQVPDVSDPSLLHAHNITAETVDQIKVEVVTTMAFVSGVIQVLMGILNLGCLSIFFSDVMMRGCVMAAVLQMIVGQLPSIFGVTIPKFNGPLSSVYSVIDVCKSLPKTNIATLVTSLICIVFLVVINECVNVRYKHKLKIPVPTEIILISLTTLISYYVKLDQTFGVKILNYIPTGLPSPTPPNFTLVPEIAVDTLVLTILTFTIIMSQAKVLSSKYNCTPDISQELFANGMANVFSSFFSSMPCSFAFVRCMLLIQLGAKTMVTSLVCALTLLLVLLFIAPVFQPLPLSVLAAVIIVSLAEILSDFKLVAVSWKASVKTDSILILCSFIAVFLLDLQYGIAIGVIVSMMMVIFQLLRTKVTIKGNVDNTDIYLETKRFKKANEVNQIKIISIEGPLFFGTKDRLKRKVEKSVIKSICQHRKLEKALSNESQLQLQTTPAKLLSHNKKGSIDEQMNNQSNAYDPVSSIILDLSSVSFIDMAAIRMLSMLKDDLDKLNVTTYFAAPKENVFKVLERSELQSKCGTHIYPNVHEAVKSAQWQNNVNSSKNEKDLTSFAYANPTFSNTL